ncbi:fumarylacetoacetate hydrolase [Piscinibacter koreensis]|uniref:Fumarylacetoacetate hydrolase n=1 Tax=Piscinibacter koreensis TaxID=2742824 RepID=A0A7Y6NJ99_9BURK|nr:fumarylacetoacetate hydrolase [Schlegelella koreensis]NUZ04192.1 fumarylacetoacetate hydrolase [Schlegelella koreensis]
MKLATYRDGSRDGQLVVVSRDLATAHYASGTATRLQQVLDDWNFVSPQLEAMAQALDCGKARHAFAFDPARCMAPLPRAFGRVHAGPVARGRWQLTTRDGSGLVGPGEAWAAAAAAANPDGGEADASTSDAEAEASFAVVPWLAVITGDIAPGTPAGATLEGVRLLMLGADVTLGGVDAVDGEIGLDAAPLARCGPVVVTPDEFGADWQHGRLARALAVQRGGTRAADVPVDLPLDFGSLLAALAARRAIAAGTIVGSAFRDVVAPAREASREPPEAPGAQGSATDEPGASVDEPALRALSFAAGAPGSLRIEVRAADGSSVFGAIAR